MSERLLELSLENWEMNVVIRALNEMKNRVDEPEEKQILSELILKVIDAPEKKMPLIRKSHHHER